MGLADEPAALLTQWRRHRVSAVTWSSTPQRGIDRIGDDPLSARDGSGLSCTRVMPAAPVSVSPPMPAVTRVHVYALINRRLVLSCRFPRTHSAVVARRTDDHASARGWQPTTQAGFSASEDTHFEFMVRDKALGESLARRGSSTRVSRTRDPLMRTNIVPGVPAVGDVWELNVEQGCTGTRDNRHGKVVSIGQHVIIVADTLNPAGGFVQLVGRIALD